MQYHPDHYAFCTNRDTGVALHVAVEAGDVEETRALLAAGASPDTLDEKRWTPLMRAARGGHLLRTPRGAHLEIMRLLLCAGANAAAATPSGWTALMSAAQHGQTEAARLLLEAGANRNAADDSGTTVLTRATWQAQWHGGSADLVRLLQKGA